jgi:hypothetical protein
MAWSATRGVASDKQKSQAFGDESVVKERPLGGSGPVPGGLGDGCLKCFVGSIREDPGAFSPGRLRVGSRVTSNEPTVAVVDPNPDWGKRPGARDDEIQVQVSIHIAGDDTQSPSLGENAEGAPASASRKIKINSILEAVRTPALCPGDGEVRTAITVQIGNRTALVAKRGCGGELYR